jgi:hypothetical protein
MLSKPRLIAVLLLSCGAISLYGSARAQSSASSVTRSRNSDGNYVVQYVVEGTKRELVFEPATKLKAYIQSEVTARSPHTRYGYRYTVANGDDSQQQLHSMSIGGTFTVPSSEVASGPEGWEADIIQATGRVAWHKVPTSWTLEGISPGRSLSGFAVVSSMLPAPGQARVRGNVWAPRVSSDVPTEVIAQLDPLLKQDYLVVPVLAPLIPAGANEPELTPATFVSRIRGHYEAELYRSGRPNGASIDRRLREAVQAFDTGSESRGRAELSAARALAAVEFPDAWHTTLGRGLTLAIDHVFWRFEW